MADPVRNELDARASTQRGQTRDKVPGFDPAAAPLETDAEAGGSHADGTASVGRPDDIHPNAATTATAMRPMGGRRDAPGLDPRWFAFGLAAIAAVLLVVFLAA